MNKKQEKNFNKKMTPELSDFIEKEIYSAATVWAMKNPKWKSNGVVEHLVKWFKK